MGKPSWATPKAAGATRNRRAPQTPKAVTNDTEPKQRATATGRAETPTVQTADASPPARRNAASDSRRDAAADKVSDAPTRARRNGKAAEPSPEPPPWQAAYLAALAENCGQRVAAAKAAGCAYMTVYRYRLSDPAFETAEADVMKAQRHVAESEAVRRAVEGVESLYTTKDGTIHSERKFSDTLLLRLLERQETGSWRQKQQIEHSGGMTFKTRAERKEALEKARAAEKQQPVAALNGRS